MTDIRKGDRPSMHGKYLGEALVIIAREGRKQVTPGIIPEPCLTCAFREGTLPNQCAGTGLMALNCTIGVDKDRFACHHGMKDGDPQKLCVGYVAAKLSPFKFTTEVLSALCAQLQRRDDIAEDQIRADFDVWVSVADPDGKLDVYQLARLYAARPAP